MSKESLTEEFRRGRIPRRAFVRGMVSLGMTVAAANRLADRASAAPLHGRPSVADDVYVTTTGKSGGTAQALPSQYSIRQIGSIIKTLPVRAQVQIATPQKKKNH